MSPDGILQLRQESGEIQQALLEYKAPYRHCNKVVPTSDDLYPVTPLPEWFVQAGLQAPVPPYYFAQLQWGMGLLKLPRCFFVVWAPAHRETVVLIKEQPCVRIVVTPRGLLQVTELCFDEEFFMNMRSELRSFWCDRYVPAVVLKTEGYLFDK